MLTRVSKKKIFFRNLMAKIGLAKPLYSYDFSASCANGIVTDFSEDGMTGRMDARDIIIKALKDASIEHIFYSVDTVLTNFKTIDRHLAIYPESEYGARIKAATGWRKLIWRFGGVLMGFDYRLYFEDEGERLAFQFVR